MVFRVFSNTTRSQVGCISAVVQNGYTFSHPKVIIPIIAITTFIVIAISLGTRLSQEKLVESWGPTTELHYFRTLPVSVVYSVIQTVYLTGTLSVNFPSNLIAFWSNFAWFVGVIYDKRMQAIIDKLRGNKIKHYGQEHDPLIDKLLDILYSQPYLPNSLRKRDVEYGSAMKPGFPIPGTYYGFGSTLAASKITASNAFLTSVAFTLFAQLLIAVSFHLLVRVVRFLAKKESRMQWMCFRNWGALVYRLVCTPT